VHVPELRVGEAEPLGQVAAQVVVHRVRDAREVAQHGAALGMLQVERDGFLAAVERLKVQRVVALGPGTDGTGAVATPVRVLHLDDLGAEIGEQQRAERAGAELRYRDDTKPVERRFGGHHSGGRGAGLRRGWPVQDCRGCARSPSVAWFLLGGSAVRLNVMTRSPRWLLPRVSAVTVPRSPPHDSPLAGTV